MSAVVAGVFVAGFTDVAIRGMPELYARARLALLPLRTCCRLIEEAGTHQVKIYCAPPRSIFISEQQFSNMLIASATAASTAA